MHNNEEYEKASMGRLFLSTSIDLFLFIGIWDILQGLILSQNRSENPYAPMVVFLILKIVSDRYLTSPGRVILSMEGNPPLVPLRILQQENGFTKTIGVITFMWGSFFITTHVGDIEIPRPPIFGVDPSETLYVINTIITKILLCCVGIFYLKLRIIGFWIGMGGLALKTLSFIMSKDLWIQYSLKTVEIIQNDLPEPQKLAMEVNDLALLIYGLVFLIYGAMFVVLLASYKYLKNVQL